MLEIAIEFFLLSWKEKIFIASFLVVFDFSDLPLFTGELSAKGLSVFSALLVEILVLFEDVIRIFSVTFIFVLLIEMLVAPVLLVVPRPGVAGIDDTIEAE